MQPLQPERQKSVKEVFDHFAHAYQDRYMDQSEFVESLTAFCDFLDSGELKVLDVACGPGNITKFILSRNPRLDILGIDLSSKMIALAQRNNPQARFDVMDCTDLSSLHSKYDGIICGFGLPYLSREECLLFFREAVDHLSEKGVLYLSTMEGDYSKSGWECASTDASKRTYVHYYSLDFIKISLEQMGCHIAFEKVNRENPVQKSSGNVFVIARKQF